VAVTGGDAATGRAVAPDSGGDGVGDEDLSLAWTVARGWLLSSARSCKIHVDRAAPIGGSHVADDGDIFPRASRGSFSSSQITSLLLRAKTCVTCE